MGTTIFTFSAGEWHKMVTMHHRRPLESAPDNKHESVVGVLTMKDMNAQVVLTLYNAFQIDDIIGSAEK